MAKLPSLDLWLCEAKADASAAKCGMYLFHNGTVRETAKAAVRCGEAGLPPVSGMVFSCDAEKMSEAVRMANMMDGIYYVRVWMNSGSLSVGDSIMLVLVGGDTRPHVVAALEALVEELKTNCVTETEVF